jgi:hypothetical protein
MAVRSSHLDRVRPGSRTLHQTGATRRPPRNTMRHMKAVSQEWEHLRLSAAAVDRERAAQELKPAFEQRMRELGYGPIAIAHAAEMLAGPYTVAEVQAELADNALKERLLNRYVQQQREQRTQPDA